MKKRYYLRGLGLGILFTAVFFMIGGKSKPAMSDEMVIERAKELGMIESTVLADIDDNVAVLETDTDETENVLPESIEETVVSTMEEESVMSETETVEATSEETIVETDTEEQTESVEETTLGETEASSEEASLEENTSEEETTKEDAQTGQLVSIIVNKGEGSDTVSRRLYEAGLVEDSYEFDRYLMQNGYDKRIAAGEHLIPMGASWEEIAKLLTS